MSFVVELTIVGARWPFDFDVPGPEEHIRVLYCNTCRRWGRVGTTHICDQTWAERLSDLLLTFVAERA